ncbi:MAG: DUF4163 domain-containing protein [Firmicutes bacterium]|nr:DUF4163 domain-containing protein [Bacillota bacterium]
MKKFIAIAAAFVMTLSGPAAGFAATSAQDIITNKRIYYTQNHSGGAMTYQTARVKVSKKTGKKEYLKVDIVFPNMKGYSTVIKEFNEANKNEFRDMSDNFVKEYAKEAQKYMSDVKFVSSKAEAPYSLKVEYSMKYNKENVISVLYTITTTVAGASHTEYKSCNYDFVTGKDIVPDQVSLIPTAGETMELALKSFNSKTKNKKIYKDVEITEDDVQFYFEKQAVTFYVQPGFMADESLGIVTYRLTDDSAREYLRKKEK